MASKSLTRVLRFVRRISFLPRDERIYVHLQGLTDLIAESSSRLMLLMIDGHSREEQEALRRDVERAKSTGKEVQRTITGIVDRAIVTPFPRQEIAELTDTLHDILGSLKKAANLYFYFQIEDPPEELRLMAEFVGTAGEHISQIICPLQNFTHPEDIYHAIQDLESRADDIRAIQIPTIIHEASSIKEIKRAIALMKVLEELEVVTDIFKDVTVQVKGVIDSHV